MNLAYDVLIFFGYVSLVAIALSFWRRARIAEVRAQRWLLERDKLLRVIQKMERK